MDGRHFVTHAGIAGAAAAVLASPAQVQTASLPDVRWRSASSYLESLGLIFAAMELLAKRVGELTSGKLSISLHAAGKLLPAMGPRK